MTATPLGQHGQELLLNYFVFCTFQLWIAIILNDYINTTCISIKKWTNVTVNWTSCFSVQPFYAVAHLLLPPTPTGGAKSA